MYLAASQHWLLVHDMYRCPAWQLVVVIAFWLRFNKDELLLLLLLLLLLCRGLRRYWSVEDMVSSVSVLTFVYIWDYCYVRYRRLRLRSAGTSSRLTILSMLPRDSGVYACRAQLDTDQLTVIVLTTAAAPRRSGNFLANFVNFHLHNGGHS